MKDYTDLSNSNIGTANFFGSYRQSVLCTNCGKKELVSIPKGKRINDYQCSNCGCKTLVKN